MIDKIEVSIRSGQSTPMLGFVLAMVAILGTTARGDSSSGSSGAQTGTLSSAASRERSPIAGMSIESIPSSGLGSGPTGGSDRPKEPIGAPALGEPITPALVESTSRVPAITDLPIVADRQTGETAADRAAGTETGAMTFPVGPMVRLLVFGTVGVLLMWQLRRKWKPQARIARTPENGGGKRVKAA